MDLAAGTNCPRETEIPRCSGHPAPPGSLRSAQARMTDLLSAGELLDEALTAALGPVDDDASDAIAGICNDALGDVLGPLLLTALRWDHRALPLIAPWVWDLARGLQFQSRHGAPEPATAELLACLGSRQLAGHDIQRLAGTVDLAAALTLGRVLEQVLGPGAAARDPGANEAAAPWLTGLKLGSRIHLVLELLRLLPSGETTGTC